MLTVCKVLVAVQSTDKAHKLWKRLDGIKVDTTHCISCSALIRRSRLNVLNFLGWQKICKSCKRLVLRSMSASVSEGSEIEHSVGGKSK